MRIKPLSSSFLISGLLSLIVCACLAFWQKDNLKSVWNECRYVKKAFYYSPDHGLVPIIPAIKGKTIQADPEAAAVANYNLSCWASYHEEQAIETLSENIIRFPQNQYFIYELAERLFYSNKTPIDPAILLKLSERLIELDSQNSLYYYIKAQALFKDRKNNNFDSVSQAIKKANACKHRQTPYLIYRDRVVSLAKKQGMYYRLIADLSFANSQTFATMEIHRTLIQYQNLLITEGDFAKADEVANLLKIMPTDRLYGLRINYMAGGFGFWTLPQEVELQRKNLTTQQANQKRLEICAMVYPEKKSDFTCKRYESEEKIRLYGLTISPFLYFSMMAGVFTILTAILILSPFFWTDCINIKISKLGLFRFLIYSSVYFFASQFLLIKSFWDSLQCCFSYYDVLFSRPLGIADLKDMLDFFAHIPLLFSILLITAACIGIIVVFKYILKAKITRFILAIAVSTLCGSVWLFLRGNTYIRYMPVIIFLLFAVRCSFGNASFKNIILVFCGKQKNITADLRANITKLSFIMFIISWLGVLCLVPMVQKSIQMKESEYQYDIYYPAKDYEMAYQNLLKSIADFNAPEPYSMQRRFSLLKSTDLPNALQKLKTVAPYSIMPFRRPMPDDDNSPPDKQFCFLLHYAGRDQMPAILSYMDDPNQSLALVARANLGDKQVKDKLLAILNETKKIDDSTDNWQSNEPREFELVSALSVISEPNETYALVKEYFNAHSANQIETYFNRNSLCTLPKETVLKIINLYLDKVKNETGKSPIGMGQPSIGMFPSSMDINESTIGTEYNFLYPLRNLNIYWDSQTAKRILNLILRAAENDNNFESFGIECYLTADVSDLLVKGLQSKNENLRAWCLWQLKKMNFKFEQSELKKLADDKSWKVRGNLAVISKSSIREIETSAYVKLLSLE